MRTAPVAAAADPAQPPASSPQRRLLLALGAIGGCGVLVAAMPRVLSAYGVVAGMHPGVGMLLVGLCNFVSVVSCFPANMGLMISAGAALGARNAFIALYFSKLMAACFAFTMARGVLAGWAQRRLEAFPKLHRALRKSSQGGWKMVLTMRLSPFPGFLLNYLLAVTGVAIQPYALGTAIGILPSIANLTLIGAAAREVGVGAAAGGVNWLKVGIKVLMAGATVLVMAFVTKEAKKAFNEEDSEDGRAEVVEFGQDAAVAGE